MSSEDFPAVSRGDQPELPPQADAEAFRAASAPEEEGDALRPSATVPWRPPHPSFFWSILWCVAFLFFTQLLPALGVMFVISLPFIWKVVISARPADEMNNFLDFLNSKAFQDESMPPAMAAAGICGILFSLLLIRLAAGRDWPRQLAMRLPSFSHLLLVLLGFPSLLVLGPGAYVLAKMNLPGMNHLPAVVVALGAAIGIVGLPLMVLQRLGRWDWRKRLADSPILIQYGVACLGAACVLVLCVFIYQKIQPHVFSLPGAPEGMMEEMEKKFRDWPLSLALLIVALGPALGEELWCRGFLGRGLVGTYGPVVGVLLTSFFFGAIHGDPHQGAMAALLGIVLHYSYLMTRSLFTPMLLHFCNNALAMLSPYIPSRIAQLEIEPTEYPWYIPAAAGTLLLAVGWALYTSRARLAPVDGSDLPPWQPQHPGVAYPPAGCSTRVAHPTPHWHVWLVVIISTACFFLAYWWGMNHLPTLAPADSEQHNEQLEKDLK